MLAAVSASIIEVGLFTKMAEEEGGERVGEKEDRGGEGYITIGVIIVNDKQYFYD